MSDYRPTEKALKEKFPRLTGESKGLGSEDGPLGRTARLMVDQVYRSGRNITEARRGFEDLFTVEKGLGSQWAADAESAAGGIPWDDRAYQHALASVQTYHRMGAALPQHLRTAIGILGAAYPKLSYDMLEGIVLAFRNMGAEDANRTTAEASERFAENIVFWSDMSIQWVIESHRLAGGIPWSDAAYRAAQQDPDRIRTTG